MCEVLFEEYDKNKNGFIDANELQMIVKDAESEIGLKAIPEQEVKEAFIKFDKNNDQQLSKEEFQEFGYLLFGMLLVQEMEKEFK